MEREELKQTDQLGDIAPSLSAMGQSGSLDFVQVDPAFQSREAEFNIICQRAVPSLS